MGAARHDGLREQRRACLLAVTDRWPDLPETHALVTGLLHDHAATIRQTAIEQLAANWSRDPGTRLAVHEAILDADARVRQVAVEQLAARWPHDPELGQFQARLRVTDSGGRVGLTSIEITVGNTAPEVTIQTPANGGFFDWGEPIPFRIGVTDAEDGNSPVCSRVQWQFGLGHDAHAHPETTGTGCTGAWPTPANAPDHGETENIYGVIVVSYRDNGANGVPSALGEAVLTVNPKLLQAEHNDTGSGVTRTADDTASGKFKITSFDAGDWIAYDPVDFTGIDAVETRVAGAGTLSLRWNSPTAKPFATATVSSGSGWRTVTTDLDDAPTGTGRLYVTSSGGLDVDSFTFQGEGIADATPPTATLTLNPAEPNGKRGWYNTNVTVRVDASDDGVVASRQYSLDGGATWVNVPNNGLVLSADGETRVRYRALDSGGNISEAGRAKVNIDKTAPVLSVSGVEARQYGIAETIIPVFTSADATSGIATLKGEIDRDKIASGIPIPLSRLGAGEHALTVTTTDRAGHTVTRTVTFTVVA